MAQREKKAKQAAQTAPKVTDLQTQPKVTDLQTQPKVTDLQTQPKVTDLQTQPKVTDLASWENTEVRETNVKKEANPEDSEKK